MRVSIGKYPHNPKKDRKIKVKIHDYDIWDTDVTLAIVILPLLKAIKELKRGSGYVDDEDVLEEFRSTSAPPKKQEYDIDENHHARWEYVLDEMIWAFDAILNPTVDFWVTKPDENELAKDIKAYINSGEYDDEAAKTYEDRIDNGCRLFGKYFRNLWT